MEKEREEKHRQTWMTLNKKNFIYIYKLEKYKVIKKNKIQKQNKKNGCASKVLAVGSSTELSSLLWFSELLQVPTASEVDDLLLP